MKKNVIFPGSFDPFTIGHEAIVTRALQLFDKVIIGVGCNSEKKYMFPIEQRMGMIKKTFEGNDKVEVITYQGLTVELCQKLNVFFLIRGLRTSADFEFERAVGQINKQLDSRIETIFMLVAPEHNAISSSIVRDIIRNKGDVSQFLPKQIDMKNYII